MDFNGRYLGPGGVPFEISSHEIFVMKAWIWLVSVWYASHIKACQENRPIFLMTIDAHILTKIFTISIANYQNYSSWSSWIYPKDLWTYRKLWIVMYYINIIKAKNNVILSKDVEEGFDKIQHHFMIQKISSANYLQKECTSIQKGNIWWAKAGWISIKRNLNLFL